MLNPTNSAIVIHTRAAQDADAGKGSVAADATPVERRSSVHGTIPADTGEFKIELKPAQHETAVIRRCANGNLSVACYYHDPRDDNEDESVTTIPGDQLADLGQNLVRELKLSGSSLRQLIEAAVAQHLKEDSTPDFLGLRDFLVKHSQPANAS